MFAKGHTAGFYGFFLPSVVGTSVIVSWIWERGEDYFFCTRIAITRDRQRFPMDFITLMPSRRGWNSESPIYTQYHLSSTHSRYVMSFFVYFNRGLCTTPYAVLTWEEVKCVERALQ